MTDYVIINGTGVELTNVNAGGDDVAPLTVSGNLTLDAAELAAVASANGVAVMQASATTAELLLVYQALGIELDLEDPSAESSVVVADVSAGTVSTSTLSGSEVLLAVAAGDVVLSASLTDEAQRYAAKLLTVGKDPGSKISDV